MRAEPAGIGRTPSGQLHQRRIPSLAQQRKIAQCAARPIAWIERKITRRPIRLWESRDVRFI